MTAKTYLLKADEDWDWQDLRDYVNTKHHDETYLVSPEREAAIFKAFIKRWPDGQGVRIAKIVFSQYYGEWHGRPVSPVTFRKDNDVYFAEPIHELLER